ncbi:GerMN domain-containing protein [Amycolatopsis sp. EV170708-02-1]|uniref:GerMN domain-containing protein n=1 Tax=Amycolatopsis sp. EV170708-02-1 TaxID=2919322 RepID=UPI001F0CB567|nr:GerMN domain-containing protein [Amycolatopsis sp. EV170708-02-1]UMP05246.1 GerMN domain-containing protein [Amycolatopsis sp. EV170708-02-1]
MRKTWLAVLLLVAVVAGCGVRPSAVITGAPAPAGPANAAVLYFLSGGQPVRVLRPLADELSPASPLDLLAAGPDESERERHYTTEVPPGTAVLDQTPAPNGITVTLSVGVARLSARAVDQIVCTARDSLGGSAQITLRGEGSVRGPLSCPLPG